MHQRPNSTLLLLLFMPHFLLTCAHFLRFWSMAHFSFCLDAMALFYSAHHSLSGTFSNGEIFATLLLWHNSELYGMSAQFLLCAQMLFQKWTMHMYIVYWFMHLPLIAAGSKSEPKEALQYIIALRGCALSIVWWVLMPLTEIKKWRYGRREKRERAQAADMGGKHS